MTINKIKEELIKRYKYLYENAEIILAPYIHEQTKEEVKECNKKYGVLNLTPIIYLNISKKSEIIPLFEEKILTEKNIETTSLYKEIEAKKHTKEYLEKVKKGLLLSKNKNYNQNEKLDILTILLKTKEYIEEQSEDLENKENKLSILNEYYHLYCYKNDGNSYSQDLNSLTLKNKKTTPTRKKDDIGIKNNEFINTIINIKHYSNNSVFTENEKQQIYLKYHDEIPWDLKLNCKLEDSYLNLLVETRLIRPENTNPCGKNFHIKEDQIFINKNDKLYRYFQICPHCGYIVHVPNKLLSETVKQRIEERCKQDEYLFRKMYLYSELLSLDTKSNGQRKILKKTN